MNLSPTPAFKGQITYHYGQHNHKCKTSPQEDLERLNDIHDTIKYFVPPTDYKKSFTVEHSSNNGGKVVTLTLRNQNDDLYTVVANKGKITVVDGTIGTGSEGYTYEVDTNFNKVSRFIQDKLPKKLPQKLQDKYLELLFVLLEKIQYNEHPEQGHSIN